MDAGVTQWVTLVAAGEFPKGSVSTRTRNSVIQYLSAGRRGEGEEEGGARGGQVTRPALMSQFGNVLRGAGETTVKCQADKAFSLELSLTVKLRHRCYYNLLLWLKKMPELLSHAQTGCPALASIVR